MKALGVVSDDKLIFTEHISNVCIKAGNWKFSSGPNDFLTVKVVWPFIDFSFFVIVIEISLQNEEYSKPRLAFFLSLI